MGDKSRQFSATQDHTAAPHQETDRAHDATQTRRQANEAAAARVAKEICFTDVNNFSGPVTMKHVCTTDPGLYLQNERPPVAPASGGSPATKGKANAQGRPLDPQLVTKVLMHLSELQHAPRGSRPQWEANFRDEVNRLSIACQAAPAQQEAQVFAQVERLVMNGGEQGPVDGDDRGGIPGYEIMVAWQRQIMERARVENGTQGAHVAAQQRYEQIQREYVNATAPSELERLGRLLQEAEAQVHGPKKS